MTDTEIAQADVLTLMRTYDPPPEDFDPHTAPSRAAPAARAPPTA